MLSLLIVDDHRAFRGSARALLEAEGCVVIGEACDAASAIRAVEDLDPDVVLLDVQLPDRSGFDVAAELRVRADRPVVVLLSSRSADEYGAAITSAPVLGFLHKPDLSRQRLEALVGALG